jgi:hypothetical protein
MTFQHVRGNRNSHELGAWPHLTAADGEPPLPIRSQNRTQFAVQTKPATNLLVIIRLPPAVMAGPRREERPCYGKLQSAEL